MLLQILGQQGCFQLSGVGRCDAHKLLHQSHHRLVHLGIVLICQHTGEHDNALAGQVVFDVFDQRLDALGIVAAVDDKQRIPAHNVKPAGPGNGGKALTDMVFGDVPAFLDQHIHNRKNNCRVVQLMVAQKGQLQSFPAAAIEGLALQTVGNQTQVFKIRFGKTDILLPADFLENCLHTGASPVDHRVAAFFENAGLCPGDLLYGAAQNLDVVQADVGDDRHLRAGDHIGGVQRAAHTHLQNHDVAVVAAEVFKGDTADQLKLCGTFLHRLGKRLDPLGNFRQFFVGNGLAVDLHPLVEAVDVRRGVKAYPVAGFAQNVCAHCGGRAFAVGAGNVDIFQLVMGVSQLFQKGLGPAQAGNAALPAHGVDIFNGFVCGHFSSDSFFVL